MVLSGFFLFGYIRTVVWAWVLREEWEIGLLGEPHVCVHRAFTHGRGERDGWSLFLFGDSPEGTWPILYLPSWPFAIAAIGVLAYGALIFFEQSKRRVA